MKKILCLLVSFFVLVNVLSAQNASSADELLKWKQLLDAGVITQEEYDAQKKQVLEGKNSNSFADENSASVDTVSTIEWLIDDNLDGNKEKIIELSKSLSPSQKQRLYKDFERSAGGYFALNLLIGYGIGSFAQGNKSSGLTQLGFEVGGLGLLLSGALDGNETVMTLGGVFYFGGWIIGLISPWTYRTSHNKSLKEALNLPVENISFAPLVNPEFSQYGLLAKIEL